MEYCAKELSEEQKLKLAQKAKLEYEKKKDKLEQKLTKAYDDDDIKKIVDIKEKLINLCNRYANSMYDSYTLEYDFKRINGTMRLVADLQKMQARAFSGEEIMNVLKSGRKKVEYNDDYFYENKGDQIDS